MRLFEVKILRRIVLPVLAVLNPGDVTIKHHYTGQPIRLHSFRHKGYWFHGRRRERASMLLFEKLLSAGKNVIEVGGHIGYISLFFKRLVGSGRVIVFEPGKNNLPYIRRNLSNRNVELIEKAAGRFNGKARFYLDSLTGQNNSFLENFERLDENQKNAFVPVQKEEVEVEVVRLDDFVTEQNLAVDFIKIDVEGAEWEVLQGMANLVSNVKPALMVEVQKDRHEIFDFLSRNGYLLYNPQTVQITDPSELNDNVFALHHRVHEHKLQELGLKATNKAMAVI